MPRVQMCQHMQDRKGVYLGVAAVVAACLGGAGVLLRVRAQLLCCLSLQHTCTRLRVEAMSSAQCMYHIYGYV